MGKMFIMHDPDYREIIRNGKTVSECYECGFLEGSDDAREQHPVER